ncbi:MAG: hypothetical protein L0229_22395 [Blastocatellia bacterium]|nr:hypothetical protein [Blastocatellia bacterium]
MEQVLRKTVIIQPGGHIEIRSDELPAGAEAEVIVIVRAGEQPPSYASLFGSGRGSYTTPQEADDFIRRERDSWEQ